MTPWEDYRSKLIAIAERLAAEKAADEADFLRRFRIAYRHLVATVDGTATALGMSPFGPMPSDFSGMIQRPDVEKLFGATDEELGGL
jgi:hypothetical protein